MISSEQITLFATKLQTTQLNIRREYIQHLFLSYFYQQSGSEKILFKGGTALRIIYNSPRFSEDLDFDCIADPPKKQVIETILQNCMASMEKEGILFTLEEVKETSGGYLAILHFDIVNQIIKIQLEISFRQENNKGEIFTIANDFIPPYTLMALVADQLIVGKIHALVSRHKARDFYDLYFILRKNLLPLKMKTNLDSILSLLNSINISFDELNEFLPKSHRQIITHFKKTLITEINRNK